MGAAKLRLEAFSFRGASPPDPRAVIGSRSHARHEAPHLGYNKFLATALDADADHHVGITETCL